MQAQNVLNVLLFMLYADAYCCECVCIFVSLASVWSLMLEVIHATISLVSLYGGWQVKQKRFTQLIPRPHFMPAYFKPPLCRMCATIY